MLREVLGFSGWVAATWLVIGCATYEPSPLERNGEGACGEDDEPCGGSGGAPSAAGTTNRAGSAGSVSGGSSSSAGRTSAGSGNAGGASAGKGGTGGGSAGSTAEPSAGSAGRASTGGASGVSGAAGSSVGGNATGAQQWSFEQGAEGWAVREQSPELAAMLTPGAGAVQLVDVPFSATKQFVDFAYTFPSPADLRGRTLRAKVRRTAGAFVGAQLYVYGAEWGSPGFDSLSSGNETTLTLSLDALAAMGVTPAAVSRIGLKFGTGSNASNAFGVTTIEITEVALE